MATSVSPHSYRYHTVTQAAANEAVVCWSSRCWRGTSKVALPTFPLLVLALASLLSGCLIWRSTVPFRSLPRWAGEAPAQGWERPSGKGERGHRRFCNASLLGGQPAAPAPHAAQAERRRQLAVEVAVAWLQSTVAVYIFGETQTAGAQQAVSSRLGDLGIPFQQFSYLDLTALAGQAAAWREDFWHGSANRSRTREEADAGHSNGGDSTAEAVACAFGYLRVMKAAAEASGGPPLVLILEDTAVLAQDFAAILLNLLVDEAPCDWTAISLHAKCPSGNCASTHMAHMQSSNGEPGAPCGQRVDSGLRSVLFRANALGSLIEQLESVVWSKDQPDCLDLSAALVSVANGDGVGYYAVPSTRRPSFVEEDLGDSSAPAQCRLGEGQTAELKDGPKNRRGPHEANVRSPEIIFNAWTFIPSMPSTIRTSTGTATTSTATTTGAVPSPSATTTPAPETRASTPSTLDRIQAFVDSLSGDHTAHGTPAHDQASGNADGGEGIMGQILAFLSTTLSATSTRTSTLTTTLTTTSTTTLTTTSSSTLTTSATTTTASTVTTSTTTPTTVSTTTSTITSTATPTTTPTSALATTSTITATATFTSAWTSTVPATATTTSTFMLTSTGTSTWTSSASTTRTMLSREWDAQSVELPDTRQGAYAFR